MPCCIHKTTERPQVTKINDICRFLDSFAPTRLAEDWDNVGLLAGDPETSADRIMTCLTITPESAAEAIAENANLIVSHHPLPFRPLKRLTTETVSSKLLLDLIKSGVSIYSPHTGFDSASEGINQTLSERIGMTKITPLTTIIDEPDGLGAGRIGELPSSQNLADVVATVKSRFSIEGLHIVGDLTTPVRKIAVACGSGGSFLGKAISADCDTFVTGETTFHTCLEAKANNISLILLGHYASERFAVEDLANRLRQHFDNSKNPRFKVWASQAESDPLVWV